MRYKTFKRIGKNYIEKYSRKKETKEICLEINDEVEITITEHQLGMSLCEPYVNVQIGSSGYSMYLSDFIKNIIRK